MRIDNIRIGDIDFKWGLDISDIQLLLEHNKSNVKSEIHTEYYQKGDKQDTLIIELNECFGININSCHLIARNDRLIDTIYFNLCEVEEHIDTILERLDLTLGKRVSNKFVGKDFDHNLVSTIHRWQFDNVNVGISFYNRALKEYNRNSYGVISISLQDIDLIYSLYTPEYKAKIQVLEKNLLSTNFHINIHDIDIEQENTNGHYANEFPSHDKDYVIMAFDAFDKNNLLPTSKNIQKLIQKNQVCIFSDPVTSNTYIANYYKTYHLHKDVEVSWWNILPAKGPGRCIIDIDKFQIFYKNHSRPETVELIKNLEHILKIKISCLDSYDC